MRNKVVSARRCQQERFNDSGMMINGRMNSRQVRRHCELSSDCESLLRQAMTQLGLSARAHDKILRIARTMADLESVEDIQPQHITEAIHYRRLDRQL